MKIVRRSGLVGVAVAGLLCLSLSACSSSDDTQQTTTKGNDTMSTTISTTASMNETASTAETTKSSDTKSSTTSVSTTTTGSTVTNAPTSTTTTTAAFRSVSLNDPRIAYLSRTVSDEYTAVLDWSGSGFELAVRGGTVKANLSGPDASMDAAVWMAVYVNGERTRKFPLKEGFDEWYTLAEDLPADTVTTIRVVKLSEASWGKATLLGLSVTGTLETPTLPERRIVWIGDSITCGFGVLGTARDPFSTKTQDVTLTYGWLLSDTFNAQRHIVSVSGYGVATANTGSTTQGLMPNVYPYTGFGTTDLWDYDNFQPDLVVVNLGTNDIYGGTNATTLRGGVRSFLTQLRTAHPASTIVWVYGLMRDDLSSEIQAEVEAFAKTDNKVYFLPAAIAQGSDEIGSADHPSDDAHARLARTLEPQLAAIMGW